MTGTTSSQSRLIERLIEVSADASIDVVAYFDGLPTGFGVHHARETDGVLEFETPNEKTVRIRSDTLIGIVEEEAFSV